MIRNATECTLSNLPVRRRDRWPTGPGFRVQAQAQAYDDAVSLSSALLDAIHFRPQWSGLLVDYLSRFLEFYLVSHAENRVPNSFVFPPFMQDNLFLYQTPGITNDPGTWFLRGMARRRWYRLDFNPHGGMAWRDVHAPPEGLARDFHTYFRRWDLPAAASTEASKHSSSMNDVESFAKLCFVMKLKCLWTLVIFYNVVEPPCVQKCNCVPQNSSQGYGRWDLLLRCRLSLIVWCVWDAYCCQLHYWSSGQRVRELAL